MTKILEVIRLHFEAGLSNLAAAWACQVSNSTMEEYHEQAVKAGLRIPIE